MGLDHASSRRRAVPALLAWCLLAAACDDPPPNDPGTPGGDDGEAWFEIGQGDDPTEGWVPLSNGDPLYLETGGQGLMMFALPVRAGGFPLPDDPKDYSDPTLPEAEVLMDVADEQYNIGVGGHFFRLVNYPLTFDVLEDGTYQFYWITVFPPDELLDTIDDLNGLDAHLEVTVTPHGQSSMVQTFDVVIDTTTRIDDPPPADDDCPPGANC